MTAGGVGTVSTDGSGRLPARMGRAAVRIVRSRFNWWDLLLIPGLVLVGVFFLWPVGEMAAKSLTDPSPANYTQIFGSLERQILRNTLKAAAIITLVTFVIGYVYAYTMAHARSWLAALFLALLLLPLWSSLLVRSFAWLRLLQDTGLVNDLLKTLHIIDESLPLSRNLTSIVIGMSSVLLPFMVLPILASARKIDPSLVRAAEGLGAGRLRAFLRVYLPLTMPGIRAGVLLVFILCLGFYITPALLGGPRNTFFGEHIARTVSLRLQFGRGSAMGMLLLGLTLAVFALFGFLNKLDPTRRKLDS